MKRVMISVLAGGSVLAACSSTTPGHAVFVGGALPPTSTVNSLPLPAFSSPPPLSRTGLCSLLNWSDLGYPGTEGGASPTKTDVVAGAQASCEWSSQQFYAGYTPPSSPSCNNDNSADVGVHLSCMGDDAEQFAAIENNSTFVAVTIASLAGSPTPEPTSYVDAGRMVYLRSSGWTCTGRTTWDHGTIAVADTDDSKAFGSPCDEVKKVISLLIQREPR